MKMIITSLIALLFATTCSAQNQINPTEKAQSFRAGGKSITIPAPVEMVEVGYENREVMEIFVPSCNRLLAWFVPAEDLPRLSDPNDETGISTYASVQILRQLEHYNLTASEFDEITSTTQQEFASITNSSVQEGEDEFNRRMKALDLDDAIMNIGDPIQLGCLFSNKNAYGFGMLAQLEMGGETMTMGMGGALVNINNRLLYVYLYTEYENEGTISWLRQTTRNWVDSILVANGHLLAAHVSPDQK